MNLNDKSKYPTRRTYVLKLRDDAAPGNLVGRIENLVTGHQRAFSSAEELLQSLTLELATAHDLQEQAPQAD